MSCTRSWPGSPGWAGGRAVAFYSTVTAEPVPATTLGTGYWVTEPA